MCRILKQLACRFYKIETKIAEDVKSLLLQSKKGKPLHFDTYPLTDEDDIDLSIVIKDRFKNAYGTEVLFTVDQVAKLQDREKPNQAIRYFKEYQVQVIHDKSHFSDYVIVFGPKVIDRSLTNAIKNYLGKGSKKVPDPFILIKVDFKTNIEALTKEFPNLQHFCIKDIPDERMKGVVVKGNSLEETDLFERFVIDEDTSGPINFLGVSTDFGKLVYLGTDGSVYSRMNFATDDTIKMIYDLFVRLKKINALIKPLDDF
jgi:hypothetical protein